MDIDRDLFRASAHYVWRQDAALGEGAFGTVYKGVHKETCEAVAVKTFNKQAFRRSNIEHVERELKILQILNRLKHPNVVKLIAIEDEIVLPQRNNHQPLLGRDLLYGKVVIMELCTEGSLYSIIEQPDNHYGLEESELIRVLSHTTAGLKYLRENRIVHRDWKPSNILKTITSDGDVLYKLCDFGAARELDDDQPFNSIVGTEEYISPDMYGKALLGLATPYFTASSELWSLGVTYYHVITGRLPFKPYGGRQNRATMFQITSKKKSGDISGVQETEGGEITYSQELPLYCRLSRSCRVFFTELLRGLFEGKKEKIWSFDTYFNTVESFLCKLRISCVTSIGRNDFVYLDKEAHFKQFVETAAEQFAISPDAKYKELLCFQEGQMFSLSTHRDMRMPQIAEKSSKFPLLFICVSHSDPVPEENKPLPEKPEFSPLLKLDDDYDVALKTCSLSFWVFRMFKEQLKNQEMFQKAAELLLQSLNTALQDLHSRFNSLSKHWQLTCAYLQVIKSTLHVDKNAKQIALKEKNAKKTEFNIVSLGKDIESIMQEMKHLQDHVPAMSQNNILTILDRIIVSIFDTIDQFKRDKILPQHGTEIRRNNELKWHDLLKKQLKHHCEFIEQEVDKNTCGKELMKFQQFFTKLLEQKARVRVAKEGIDIIEDMIFALDSSFKQIVEINSKPILTEKNTLHIQQQNTENSTKLCDRLKNVDISNSLLETVKDIQQLRKTAENNRQMLSDCIILTKSFD